MELPKKCHKLQNIEYKKLKKYIKYIIKKIKKY